MKPMNISNAVPRCLLVEDDDGVAEVITESLKNDGYIIKRVTDGESALALCKTENIDIVLLDFSLPGISGQKVCRDLREFSDAYVLMVTANNNELDRVLCLSLGADDYVTKPFAPAELRERVRAMLRRPRHHVGTRPVDANTMVKQVGDLTFDSDARLAATEDGYIDLTELEYNLLSVLVGKSPEPISRKEIIESVWDRNYKTDDHIVDVHISNIRGKFRNAGVKNVRIQSVRSLGYRLLPESR